ncbi:MAG: hypothetical protein JNG86_00985 [Verrucomicrobiaceae bacterium]|nr:hypothetical protein [Verrucomicrobiaceae bacterium]
MEPFSPQDPIQKLLAQAREVEVRSNFTQNVVRAARQTPQERGWLAGLRAWWQESSLAGSLTLAGGAVAAMALAFVVMQPAEQPGTLAVTPPAEDLSVVSDMPLLPETEAPWDSSLQTESLLAVEDTSLLTDSEISFLLY